MKPVLIVLSAALALSLGLNFYALNRISDVEASVPTSVEDLDDEYVTHMEQLEMAKDKIDALEEQVDDLETKVRNLPSY